MAKLWVLANVVRGACLRLADLKWLTPHVWLPRKLLEIVKNRRSTSSTDG
jgi:hypothetical protein